MGMPQLLMAADRDPHWNDVSILLTAVGTLGGTVFTDQSRYANTLTTFGGAVIDNGQSVVGGQAIYCPSPPTNSGITFNGSQSHFNFGTDSLTIEMFRWIPIGTTNAFCYRLNLSTGNPISSYLSSSNHNVNFRVGSSIVGTVSGYSFEGNVWRHEALVYDANPSTGQTTVSFFCNGIRYFNNTYATGSGISLSGSGAIGVGFAPMTNPLRGWLDQFRITRRVARYSGATYNIPNVPFPNS